MPARIGSGSKPEPVIIPIFIGMFCVGGGNYFIRLIVWPISLVWPCDLIVAADNAKFSDPVVHMGIGGVECHGHTWELGHRKAKEILFMSSSIDAATALQLGMVNKVVGVDELFDAALAMARVIAQKPAFGLAMAKRAVNRTMDIMGFDHAIEQVFDIHELGHGNAQSFTGQPIIADLEGMKKKLKSGD